MPRGGAHIQNAAPPFKVVQDELKFISAQNILY